MTLTPSSSACFAFVLVVFFSRLEETRFTVVTFSAAVQFVVRAPEVVAMPPAEPRTLRSGSTGKRPALPQTLAAPQPERVASADLGDFLSALRKADGDVVSSRTMRL